jgi:hypothetical protein
MAERRQQSASPMRHSILRAFSAPLYLQALVKSAQAVPVSATHNHDRLPVPCLHPIPQLQYLLMSERCSENRARW